MDLDVEVPTNLLIFCVNGTVNCDLGVFTINAVALWSLLDPLLFGVLLSSINFSRGEVSDCWSYTRLFTRLGVDGGTSIPVLGSYSTTYKLLFCDA